MNFRESLDKPLSADPLSSVRESLIALTAHWSSGTTLAEIRSSFEKYLNEVGPRGAAMARPVAVSSLDFGAAWLGQGTRSALYCHGGGFQIGSIASHASLIARLAEASDTQILAFDYRLAPEHRYPAAVDDAFAAYQWILEYAGAPEAVIGDSAGAALAMLAVQRARDAGLPLPRAIVLISPWLDLSMQGGSYERLASSDIFSKPEQLQIMARSYLGRQGPRADAPEVSPLWGDLSDLPPVLIHSGAADITLDDSIALAERINALGGRAELRIFDGMCHHFQVFEALPEADESVVEIGEFIRRL